MYINRIKNRATLKIMTEYTLDLLMPDARKLLEIKEKFINKDGKNSLHLEIQTWFPLSSQLIPD